MNTRETYKGKMEAELEQFQTKLAEFKAQPKGVTVWERARYIRRFKELEQRVALSTAILEELDEVNEDVWGQAKRNMENTWESLQAEMQKAIASA
jgi:hypothetical protein